MKLVSRTAALRSVLSNTLRALAVVVVALCYEQPTNAAEFLLETSDGLLAFETEQDRQDYITWVKGGGRSAWLYFSESLMRPCRQGLNRTCQENMVVLRDRFPIELTKARLVVNGMKDRFMLALRNGNFIYPAAPSYQLLHAIIRRPGDCASWSAVANQRLKMKSGALRVLSNDADAELPSGSGFPERAILDGRAGQPGLLELARGCNAL